MSRKIAVLLALLALILVITLPQLFGLAKDTLRGSRNANGAAWRPPVGTTFQWQLQDPPDLTVEADVFDLDLFNTTPDVIEQLHQKGARVFCYMSVGTWEDWRPDASAFPRKVLGKQWPEWPGERWLDIRRIDLLAPVIEARLDLCQAKGFDGVEPDNMEGYLADTGFRLTAEDQLRYDLWLAEEAHERGLSIGLKNSAELAAQLEPHFDWALAEDCHAEGWCDALLPFVEAGKAVFTVEYSDTDATPEAFCADAREKGFTAIFKDRDLDAYVETCDSALSTP